MLSIGFLSSSGATENRMPIIAMTTVNSMWVKAVNVAAPGYLFLSYKFWIRYKEGATAGAACSESLDRVKTGDLYSMAQSDCRGAFELLKCWHHNGYWVPAISNSSETRVNYAGQSSLAKTIR